MNATNATKPDVTVDAAEVKDNTNVATNVAPKDSGTAVMKEVEAEIREFVRRDATQLRKPEANSEVVANNINSLVQRVAGSSVAEIEHLISELESLRDFLYREGERVQREIAGYAQLSQAAMSSTKIIADSMTSWKKQVDAQRKH
jgi:hypothetical protein